MVIDGKPTAFELGEMVYLKAAVLDGEPSAACIDGVVVSKSTIMYQLTWADRSSSTHYDFEMTRNKYPVDEEGSDGSNT